MSHRAGAARDATEHTVIASAGDDATEHISQAGMPVDQQNNAPAISTRIKRLMVHTTESIQAEKAVYKDLADLDWPPCFQVLSHRGRAFEPTTRLWYGCEVCTSSIKEYNRECITDSDPEGECLTLPSEWRCFGCQKEDICWRHQEIPNALESLCWQCRTAWQCIQRARRST